MGRYIIYGSIFGVGLPIRNNSQLYTVSGKERVYSFPRITLTKCRHSFVIFELGCPILMMMMMMMMMDELLSCHKVQGTARTRNSKMCHAVMSVQ